YRSPRDYMGTERVPRRTQQEYRRLPPNEEESILHTPLGALRERPGACPRGACPVATSVHRARLFRSLVQALESFARSSRNVVVRTLESLFERRQGGEITDQPQRGSCFPLHATPRVLLHRHDQVWYSRFRRRSDLTQGFSGAETDRVARVFLQQFDQRRHGVGGIAAQFAQQAGGKPSLVHVRALQLLDEHGPGLLAPPFQTDVADLAPLVRLQHEFVGARSLSVSR